MENDDVPPVEIENSQAAFVGRYIIIVNLIPTEITYMRKKLRFLRRHVQNTHPF